MAEGIFQNIKISGLCCAVPKTHVKAESYQNQFSIEEIQKFVETTGIQSRYLSNGKQTASDLCYEAARELMDKKGVPAEEIDLLIFITQNPDYKHPSTAFVLHKRLGLKQDCLAFDINLGCSAFVQGVYTMAAMLTGGAGKKGLLLVGEASRTQGNCKDHSNMMMFGDAGSACLIETGKGDVKALMKADGNGFDVMIFPGRGARFPAVKDRTDWSKYVAKMDGEETFLFAITKVPKLFREFFQKYNCSLEDFDYCVLHQSNLFMLKHIAKKIKLPEEKMPISIDRYGNTVGSTVPITIVDLCEKDDVPETLNLIACGFGVGLSWGVISFQINRKDVLPIVITDEYFAEGYDV